MILNMVKELSFLFLLAVIFQSCATYPAAQEAKTLPKHTLEVNFEDGNVARVKAGLRYGIVKGLDAGVDCNLNLYGPGPAFDADVKFNLYTSKSGNFAFSTGASCGNGLSYFYGHDNFSADVVIHSYHAPYLFLPAYFSYYPSKWKTVFSINTYLIDQGVPTVNQLKNGLNNIDLTKYVYPGVCIGFHVKGRTGIYTGAMNIGPVAGIEFIGGISYPFSLDK